jgi:aspartyl-tRNA synthetase
MTSPLATTFRTHTCGELRAANAGESVTIAGFVHGRPDDDGGPSFDVRDRYGVTRVVFPKSGGIELFRVYERLAPECVVRVEGTVAARAQRDPALETGDVEVTAKAIALLAKAEPLPPEFAPGSKEPKLEDRLRLRQLDLRRLEMQGRLAFRAKLILALRNALAQQGFVEVETPHLAKWTPEATQSFVVPAAGGKVFALPGTPQLYKQLLIAGGVDRYFQVARCFRNETRLGPEKQPEFTTLDVEMAYADEEDVLGVIDAVFAHAFEAALGQKIATPIPRLPYADAIVRYGTDRPDLRFGLELEDLTLLASLHLETPAFEDAAGACSIVAKGRAGDVQDAELSQVVSAAAASVGGQARVAWLKVGLNGLLRGPEVQRFAGAPADGLRETLGLAQGDLLVVVTARVRDAAYKAGGDARLRLGRILHPRETGRGGPHALALVTRFPFFEYDPASDGWNPARHPFTQPLEEDIARIDSDKHGVRAKAYDIVLDGVEVGAGSIRNHDLRLQQKVFEMFEYKRDEVQSRFGTVLEAFRFGVPPHGGFAVGLDRMIALLQGVEAIDEVIAFPKSREGTDPLTDSPTEMDKALLAAMLGG